MPQLGGLESKVMDVLWDSSSPLSVREVHDALSASADLAYTTVMTVLDRLAKKNLLARERDGKAWLYRPASTREELLISEIHLALRHPAIDRLAVVTAVAEELSTAERTHLTSLLGQHNASER